MSDDNANVKNPGKSGQQVGAEHVERLREYLRSLHATGSRIPGRQGKPNKSVIADACGFGRLTFYNNTEAIAVLEQSVIEIGVVEDTPKLEEKSVRPQLEGKAAHLQTTVDKKERRIQQLEETLETKLAEISDLRRELKQAQEKLRQYDLMEEVMTTSGRRFRP